MPIEPMWSAAKIAAYMGVNVQTVYRWMWEGLLPTMKVGNTRRAKQSDVQRLVNKRQADMERGIVDSD